MTTERDALAADAVLSRESFFSSEQFLGAVARSHFAGKPWKVEAVTVEGRAYRVLTVGGRVVQNLWTHPFFYEPLDETPPGARPIPYLASVLLDTVIAPAEGIRRPSQIAPYVDWRSFPDWDAYQSATREGPHPANWKTAAYMRRLTGRRLGDVTFSPHDTAPDVLPTLFAWKDAKRQRTGTTPYFTYPPAGALYDELQKEGLLEVSTLRAGGRLIAGILGYRWHGRYYARLIAHDFALHALSPGTVLWHAVLRHSFESGDEESDLLLGDEPYKWMFATHARIVSTAGVQPAVQRLERRLRDTVGTLRLRVARHLQAAPGVRRD
jgi:hypothetical protein